MHNVEKFAKHILKSCGVNTACLVKYVWSFFYVTHERVKGFLLKMKNQIDTQKIKWKIQGIKKSGQRGFYK